MQAVPRYSASSDSATARTISGAFPVLPAIFTDKGEVDETGFRRVIDFVIGCHVDGIVFPGLASEYDHLPLRERLELIRVLGDQARGAAFVVGGSSNQVDDTLAVIEAGARAGATVAMVLTPRIYEGDLASLAAFYRDVGRVSNMPIMLQNAPAPMGLGLTAQQVLGIVEQVAAIAYVKEETQPGGQRITALRRAAPERLRGIFGGAGGRYITDELSRGAIGTMPAAELPELHVGLVQAHRAGDEDRMRMLYERMLPVLMMQAVFRWSLTKEVLRRRGLIDSVYVRAQGPRLDAADQRELTQLLRRLEDLIGVMDRPAEQ